MDTNQPIEVSDDDDEGASITIEASVMEGVSARVPSLRSGMDDESTPTSPRYVPISNMRV